MWRRRRAESELEEELRYHLEREIQEGLKAGLAPEQARTSAVRSMGAVEKSKEECRDLRRGRRVALSLGGLVHDLRFALRLFRRHPVPVGIAVGGLALAIGVVTAAFSIVNASMLRPYGMDEPSTVVSITRPGRPAWGGWPYAQFLRMQQVTALADVEAGLPRQTSLSAASAGDLGPKRPVLFVSGGYLRMLGGRAVLGRTLAPSDDRPDAPPVIVVSHYVWQTELAGDPSAVGRKVWVNATPVTVVGVLQSSFTGPVGVRPSMWAPLSAFDDLHMGPAFTPSGGPAVEVVARLPAGGAARVAEEGLTAILAQPGESGDVPVGERSAQGVRVFAAASPMDGPADAETFVVLVCVVGISGLVLALACANAANLLMASAVTRIREVGVRLAMGATRGRLIVQMLRESLLLGLAAGGAGFLLAFWLVPILGRMVEMPPDANLAPDWRVLLFTLSIAIVCGLGAGLTPARYGAGDTVLVALRSGSGSRGTAASPSRFRAWLVGSQAAMSMLLLVCGALLLRTAVRVTNVDFGFDAGRVLAVSLEPLRPRLDQQTVMRTALAAVRALPSVERVAVTEYEPFGNTRAIDRFTSGGRSYELRSNYADAEFFSTVGLRILRGRALTANEVAREAPVALISENVARTFFNGGDALGQSVSQVPAVGGRQAPATVVGIVADAMLDGPESEIYGAIYRPLRLKPQESFTDQRFPIPLPFLVRTATPALTALAIEAALRQVAPEMRPTARLVGDGLNAYLDGRRRLAWLLGPPALLALVLATLGVYGVNMFAVSQRTPEVGVRVALGASSAQILRLLMADGLRPVLIGLLVGLGLAMAVSRIAAGELAGISPHDPLSIGGALLALLVCAGAAVLIAARRATRADPAKLLRQA